MYQYVLYARCSSYRLALEDWAAVLNTVPYGVLVRLVEGLFLMNWRGKGEHSGSTEDNVLANIEKRHELLDSRASYNRADQSRPRDYGYTRMLACLSVVPFLQQHRAWLAPAKQCYRIAFSFG